MAGRLREDLDVVAFSLLQTWTDYYLGRLQRAFIRTRTWLVHATWRGITGNEVENGRVRRVWPYCLCHSRSSSYRKENCENDDRMKMKLEVRSFVQLLKGLFKSYF
jgi:hypothetical protein